MAIVAFLITYGGAVLIGGGLLLVLILIEAVAAAFGHDEATESSPIVERRDPIW
jgi:hypothetical protein